MVRQCTGNSYLLLSLTLSVHHLFPHRCCILLCSIRCVQPSMTQDLSKQLDPTGKDVFQIIIEEHRAVDLLGEKYKQSQDVHEKQQIAHNVIKLLSLHAGCEEMALYPVMQVKLPDGPQQVAHALEEHTVVKQLLFLLDNSQVGHAHFDEKFLECLTDVQIHVQQEEEQLLPALRQACSDDEVRQMTVDYVTAKKISPTRSGKLALTHPSTSKLWHCKLKWAHSVLTAKWCCLVCRPHPEAPNQPPENRMVNAQTAPLDHVRDAGRFSSA